MAWLIFKGLTNEKNMEEEGDGALQYTIISGKV